MSKRSGEEHKHCVLNCLKRLDEGHIKIVHPKCQFSQLEIDWFVYCISQSGTSPIESKTLAILILEAPKTLKNFDLFLLW